MTPLVVVDADALGRRRTGDETYVLNLLRELAPLAPEAGLRIAAVTRVPALVPEGIEAVELATPSQELRMTLMLPRLLRGLGAALGHFQYALPLVLPCPAVVTIHDLSFEREPSLMGRKDRFVFRKVVPRAARKAARVLTVSERTRRDLRELYGVPDEKIVVTPNGVDPAFTPSDTVSLGDYVLIVGAVQERKNPLAALAAAEAAGCRSSSPGPRRTRRSRTSSSDAEPASPATSTRPSSFVSTAAPPVSSSRRGTRGLACPCSRPWRAGRRSSPCRSLHCRRWLAMRPSGQRSTRSETGSAEPSPIASVSSPPGSSGRGSSRWRESAKRTLEVYREALGR